MGDEKPGLVVRKISQKGVVQRTALVKEGTWVLVGQIAQFFGGIFFIRTMTELLSPAEFGHFSLLLTFTTLVEIALLGGLRGATTRFYSIAREEKKEVWFIGTVFLISFCISLIILAAGLVASAWTASEGNRPLALAILAIALISAISTVSGTCSALQSGARRQATVSLHNAASFWLRALLAMFIIPLAHEGHVGALYSVVAASVLIFLSQMFFLLRKEQMRLNRNELLDWSRRAFIFALPYSAWGITTWLQQVGDRWLLGLFTDTAAVGIYTAFFQTTYSPAILAGTALLSFLTPIIYQVIGDAKDAARIRRAAAIVRKLCLALIALTVLAAGVAAIIHGQIALLIVGPSYRPHSGLIPWLVLAGGLMASYHVIGSIVPALMKTQSVILPIVLLSGSALLLLFLGVQFMGLEGIVFALAASSALHLTVMWLLSRRLVETQISNLTSEPRP